MDRIPIENRGLDAYYVKNNQVQEPLAQLIDGRPPLYVRRPTPLMLSCPVPVVTVPDSGKGKSQVATASNLLPACGSMRTIYNNRKDRRWIASAITARPCNAKKTIRGNGPTTSTFRKVLE